MRVRFFNTMKFALEVFEDHAYIYIDKYFVNRHGVKYDLSDLHETIPHVVRDILTTPNVYATSAFENIILIERLDDAYGWWIMADTLVQKLNGRMSPGELVSRGDLETLKA